MLHRFVLVSSLVVAMSSPLPSYAQSPSPAVADTASGALPPPRAVEWSGPSGVCPLRLANDRPVVEARIDGRRDVVLGIETGAAFAALTRATIDSLGLPRAGEDAAGPFWRADSLRFGGIVVRDLMVRDVAPADRSIDGFLGLGVFAGVLLTIDYPAARLVLERGALPAPDGRTVLATHASGPFHAVDMTVAGRTLRFVIDTRGSSAFGLTPAAAESLRFAAPPVVVGRAGGAAIPAADVRLGRLDGDVRLGAHRFERPLVAIRPLPPGFPGGTLGSAALRNFVFTLDQRSHRVRFARDASVPIPAPPPMRDLGIRLRPRPGESPEVADVRPGTPADSLGVRPGDRVLAAGGSDSTTLDPARWRALADTGKPVPMTLRRDGRVLDVVVRPATLVP